MKRREDFHKELKELLNKYKASIELEPCCEKIVVNLSIVQNYLKNMVQE